MSVKKSATEPPKTDVIAEAIRPYAIAEKLRTLRLRKSMGLAQLADHTGLSAAMLSKLENAKLVPTLPTLVRIATVFDVGLDHFFTDERKRHVVAIARKEERIRFPEKAGVASVAYYFESLNFRAKEKKIHGFIAEFQSITDTKLVPHSHPGVEMVYLIEGSLEMRVGTETYTLKAGDAIYFDSIQQHSYRAVGSKQCTGLVVTTGS